MMAGNRKIKSKILTVEISEGNKQKARISIGGSELPNLDPFLLLADGKVQKPAGFPDHPHRGFESVTYVIEGAMRHEDFCGHKGVLEAGDVQWMTSGRGIVHSEMPEGDEGCWYLQLWVNLKKSDKMVEPSYQDLLSKNIPNTKKDGVSVVIISGEALGSKSDTHTRTPTLYLDFTLDPGAKHVQAVPEGWNAFAYMLDGAVHLDDQEISGYYIVVFEDVDSVTMENKSNSTCRFILVAGEPIKEPIAQHGAFVMNTQEEVRAAMMDFHSMKNGFEKARDFRSSALK